jgi:release factor glutamine methyltransferase
MLLAGIQPHGFPTVARVWIPARSMRERRFEDLSANPAIGSIDEILKLTRMGFRRKDARMEEDWTILKVLQWTTGYFSRKSIEQPRANAEVLLAHTLGVERIQLYIRYDQPLNTGELARFREAVRRRAAHEPTQYITREQEFWSLSFQVTPSVLIPRPETELLVEEALKILQDSPHGRVLDLGTGSGAIAVALAHERPSLHVVATDRSPEALAVARKNAVRHSVQDRISFTAMDLFGALRPSHPLFDLIVSNPPYIGDAELSGLSPEILHHEPTAALRGGGPNGLDIIRKILADAHTHLVSGGSILLEIGMGQAEVLSEEPPGNSHWEQFEFIKDYSGILRVLRTRKVNG